MPRRSASVRVTWLAELIGMSRPEPSLQPSGSGGKRSPLTFALQQRRGAVTLDEVVWHWNATARAARRLQATPCAERRLPGPADCTLRLCSGHAQGRFVEHQPELGTVADA